MSSSWHSGGAAELHALGSGCCRLCQPPCRAGLPWHLCVCVPALNALFGVPSPCWDPLGALGLFRELSSRWNRRSLVPLSWWGSCGERGTSTGSQPRCVSRERRKEKEMERKGKELSIAQSESQQSLCGAARPCNLTQEPPAHSQRPLSDNSIYLLGQGSLFPLSRVATWPRRLWLPNVCALQYLAVRKSQAGHGWDSRAVLGVQGSPGMSLVLLMSQLGTGQGRAAIQRGNNPFCFLSFKGQAALLL